MATFVGSAIHPVRLIRGIARRLHDSYRGETEDTFFDVANPWTLDRFLAGHNLPSLSADPTQADDGRIGATRYILGKRILTPGLKWYFPRPFSDGETGAFASWVADRGPSPTGAANVRSVFAEPPGTRVKR